MSSTTTTTIGVMEDPIFPMHLNANGKSHTGGNASLKTLHSLYNRATRAFIQRNFLLTYSLMESAFALLHPPTSTLPDSLSSFRRKWDVVRITLEATMYNAPLSIQKQDGYAEDTLPAELKTILTLPPTQFASSMHARSLRLFTPTPLAKVPSSEFLPHQVLLPLLLTCLKVQCNNLARAFAEDWIARRGQRDLVVSSQEEEEGYVKVIELYTMHILSRLEDWDYAEEFLSMNEELQQKQKRQMIDQLHNMRYPKQDKVSSTHSFSAQTPLRNGNGAVHFAPGSSKMPTTPRSPSPSRSSSSLSTTSTHTAVPSGPRAMNNGTLTPISRASTITPVPRDRESEREDLTASRFKTSLPRPPAAPTIEESAMDTRVPDLVTLIKSTVLPHLTTPRIIFVLFTVLFPLLSFLFKARSRRKRAALFTKPSLETSKRLELMGESLGNNVGFSSLLTVWRVVTDALSMASKGLL